jgi:predicted RNase H-like nuclease (RuvC/YqgF family)
LNKAAVELGAQCARERPPTIDRRIAKRTYAMNTATSPLDRAQRSATEALARFPGDSIEMKEQRALAAAWHVGRDAFPSATDARMHLQELFQISERQIRRAEKILDDPDIVSRVVRGPVSITNASHVLEHPGRARPRAMEHVG